MDAELTTPAVLLLGFAFFGSFEIWRRLLVRRIHGYPLLQRMPREPVPWTGLEVAGSVLIYFAAMQLAPLLMQVELPQGNAGEAIDSSFMAALSLGNLLAVFGSLLLLTFVAQATPVDLGLPADLGQAVHDLAIGVVGFLASIIPVFAIQFAATQLIPYEHPLIDLLKQPSADSRFWTIAVISAVVAAPIAEEYFFRLVLQGWLERAFQGIKLKSVVPRTPDQPAPAADTASLELAGAEQSESPYASPLTTEDEPNDSPTSEEPLAQDRWQRLGPIVISSAAFALLHLGQGPAPIPLFVLACGLGYIYQRTHRILPCITLHALFNGYSLLMLAITV